MSLHREAARGVRWTGLASLVNALVQVGQLVVLARLLTPIDFGLVAMVTIAVGYAQAYSDLGVSGALIHRQDADERALSSLYWLNVAVGLAIGAVFVLCAPLVARLFREPAIVGMLRLVAVIFVVLPFGKQFEILLQRDLRFRALSVIEIAGALAGFGVAVAGALAGHRAWSLVYGTIAGTAVRSLALLAVGWRAHQPALRLRWAEVRDYLPFGGYQMGERSVNFLSERLDQLLIGALLGAQALGLYNFAFNLAIQPLTRINPAVTRVAFPVLAKLQDDLPRLRRAYLRLLRLIVTVNAPLLLGLVAAAPVLVPAVFGPQWAPAVPLLQVLCGVSLLRAAGNPIGSLQLALGRADLGFAWNLFLLLVTIPAVAAGARLGGGLGVAVALLLLQAALQLVAYLRLVRPLVGRCGPEYAAAMLRPLGLALLMAVAVALVPQAARGAAPTALLALQVALGAGLYLALLRLFEGAALMDLRQSFARNG